MGDRRFHDAFSVFFGSQHRAHPAEIVALLVRDPSDVMSAGCMTLTDAQDFVGTFRTDSDGMLSIPEISEALSMTSEADHPSRTLTLPAMCANSPLFQDTMRSDVSTAEFAARSELASILSGVFEEGDWNDEASTTTLPIPPYETLDAVPNTVSHASNNYEIGEQSICAATPSDPLGELIDVASLRAEAQAMDTALAQQALQAANAQLRGAPAEDDVMASCYDDLIEDSYDSTSDSDMTAIESELRQEAALLSSTEVLASMLTHRTSELAESERTLAPSVEIEDWPDDEVDTSSTAVGVQGGARACDHVR